MVFCIHDEWRFVLQFCVFMMCFFLMIFCKRVHIEMELCVSNLWKNRCIGIWLGCFKYIPLSLVLRVHGFCRRWMLFMYIGAILLLTVM
jgi:hypothetical protein